MGEKELKEQLDKSNNSLEKAGKVIKDLKDKLSKGNDNSELQKEIDNLHSELESKNAKVIELAESVAKTQPPPRRVELNIKYSNKYTKTQIKAFKKNGISTENLDIEPEPLEIEA